MGQIRVIHEHYDRSPWASILAGILIVLLAISKLFGEEINVLKVIVFALTAIPMLVILIVSIIRRNKPSLVVYNDRLEVLASPTSSKKVDEIMYSDIRNIAMESGQLLIWLDETSVPMYRNLGANAANAQQTYDILRSAYDKYNQDHGINPAQVDYLPRRNKGKIAVITILIMVLILVFMLIFH